MERRKVKVFLFWKRKGFGKSTDENPAVYDWLLALPSRCRKSSLSTNAAQMYVFCGRQLLDVGMVSIQEIFQMSSSL